VGKQADDFDYLALGTHREQPALLGERHAFKFSNRGLDFIVGLIPGCHRWIAAPPALSQRSEPMAGDDRPLRQCLVQLTLNRESQS